LKKVEDLKSCTWSCGPLGSTSRESGETSGTQSGEGRITVMKVHITLKEQAKPLFWRARPVLYALKKPLEDKLGALEREGILIKVDHSS